MGKLLAVLCLALLAVTFVMACSPPGVPCTSDGDCCAPLVCNPWAGRCTKKPGGPVWGGEPGNPEAQVADQII